MDYSSFFQSRKFKIIIWVVGGLVVLLLTFRFGVVVGYRKASFSYLWGENYHRNFGGPRGGFFGEFFSDQKDFIESHGVFGQIVKIDGSTLVLKGKDNVEQIVLVDDGVSIIRFREKAALSDLETGDYVVIIGDPNDLGQIQAKLIRIMPASPKLKRGESPPAAMARPSLPPRNWH